MDKEVIRIEDFIIQKKKSMVQDRQKQEAELTSQVTTIKKVCCEFFDKY